MSQRSISGGSGAPVALSQVPGSPSFRSSAVNAIAVIPLLSSDRMGHDNPNTHSSQSFRDLLEALSRYHMAQNTSSIGNISAPGEGAEDFLLVIPNSNLTRPGDWKYEESPLKNFHWGHGCQRMTFFDGRPYNSRMAHDRLINHELSRNWIDLCPSRRAAAVIGVLNVRDCPDEATMKRAQEEWQQWVERYSTPPYEVTAHGRDLQRDTVVQRLFVFDSFHESVTLDVAATLQGARLVAFPPTDKEHIHMMDLHMNVVINDLAVSVFRKLESRIRASDDEIKGTDSSSNNTPVKSRFFPQRSKGDLAEEGAPQGSDNLSIVSLAAVVSPDSKLAARDGKGTPARSLLPVKFQSTVIRNTIKGSSTQARLLTPMDDVFDLAELNPKDGHEMLRREVGRREKFAADLSLLAGSPLDAYERYMKAAELCRSTCPDPLWYASALEGCVAAHIAMAEMGGFNVDEYLENSFQLPEPIMSCAVMPAGEKSNKQDMSSVVAALCDDALNILSRHPRLASFRAELLLKLAWYGAEIEDTHVRCQWGLGEGCYGGDPNGTKHRWESASATQLNFLELKNKHGEDVISRDTFTRSQRFSSHLHQAAAAGGLDAVTRADVALRCASLCLRGLRVSLIFSRGSCSGWLSAPSSHSPEFALNT
jgi:Transport protein Trs120 or TRAPPC9, TRAPP II complex subunit